MTEQNDSVLARRFSRRTMIAGSAAAGGLAWAAPVLSAGPAWADHVPCCHVGTPVTVKVAEQRNAVNCGVSCISHEAGINFDCPSDLVDCLNQLELISFEWTSAAKDSATIILAPGVTVIAGGVKAADQCYYTICAGATFNGVASPGHTTSQTDGTHPNFCEKQSGDACEFGKGNPPNAPLPPATGGLNRIWLVPQGDGSTHALLNTATDGQINIAEFSLCLAPEITGLCP